MPESTRMCPRSSRRRAAIILLLAIVPGGLLHTRAGRSEPWADLAGITGNPRLKSENVLESENVLVHAGWLHVTSGDGYGYQAGATGTVYRVAIDD
jgi:hypothetical protein